MNPLCVDALSVYYGLLIFDILILNFDASEGYVI